MSAGSVGPAARRRSPALPAAVGAAAALLALSTLGLTWVRRTVQGPLGEASAAQVEALTGREVAPVVAALVPGAAAAVVVALLLRGWWRAGALVVGALAATGAAVAAVGVLLPGADGAAGEGTATLTPAVAAAACLLAAAGALVGAVATVPSSRARDDSDDSHDSHDSHDSDDEADVDESLGAATSAPVTSGTVAEADPEPADLWRALDDGRDPT